MLRALARPELAGARRERLHCIGEAAHLSDLSAKMNRHYESIGLVAPATGTYASYWLDSDTDLHRLPLIKRHARIPARSAAQTSRHEYMLLVMPR
jgi:hypothetical protein